MNVCVYTTDDIARVLTVLEPTGLLERGITDFGIGQLRHTKTEDSSRKRKLTRSIMPRPRQNYLSGRSAKQLATL
jgi:hypothetical protein